MSSATLEPEHRSILYQTRALVRCSPISLLQTLPEDSTVLQMKSPAFLRTMILFILSSHFCKLPDANP